MHPDDFGQMFQAGELAGLAAYARAVFLTAREASPEVMGLAVRLKVDDGLSVIEAEYLDLNGVVVGGFSV